MQNISNAITYCSELGSKIPLEVCGHGCNSYGSLSVLERVGAYMPVFISMKRASEM